MFWTFRVATGGTELAGAGDTILYYYPLYAATGAAWRDGALPLWNPYGLCGHPWLATLQGGVLYPLHLLYVWLPTYTAMAVSSLLHLGIIGISMAVLARKLALSGWAAILAGIVFSMYGRLPGHSVVPNLLEAGAWIAPGAIAVVSLARGGTGASIAGLALCLGASLLAGYPQYSVYACYTWAALLLVLVAADRRPWREWWRPAAAFSIAIGLGALLAAPQLLASLELTDAGTRSLEAIGLQAMFPLPWPKQSVVASLFLLLAIGNHAIPFPFAITGLLLLPIAFASPQRRIVIGLVALLLLVFGMAIGPATPLFDVYRMLPGVGSFRLPTLRLLVVVGFLLAMLAAYGLDELLRRVRAGAGARTAAGVGALVVSLAAIEPLIADTKRPALPYTGLGAEAVFEGEVRLDVLPVLADEHERMLFWNPGYSPPLPSKLGAVLGVRVFDDYEPMSLRRQSDYFDYLAYGSIKQHQRSPFFGRLVFPRSPGGARKMASRRRLLDLAAVKLLVGTNSQRHNTLIHIFAKAAGLVRKPDDKSAWKTVPLVYLNKHALPRAYVTYRALPAPPADELLPRLASPSFEPRNVSYVEGPEIGRDATRRRGHAATIARDEPSEIEIHVNLAQEGLVVLADSYYPGWTVTIDGEPAEILATNHLFRGVVVPGGVHTIVYRYEPWWLPVGGVAFAGGLAGVALLAWRGLGRRSDG